MGGRFPKKQVKGADRRVSEMYIFTQFYQQTFNAPIAFTSFGIKEQRKLIV